MGGELIAALIGAVVGAVLAAGASYLQQGWSRKQDRMDKADDDRRSLARELMRHRMDQDALVKPLNEVPLLFGDDAEALRLLRAMRAAHSSDERSEFLTDLINHLAKYAGLPPQVQASDVRNGFYTRD